MTSVSIPLGVVQGRVALPADVCSQAGALGAAYHANQAANDFCLDNPETFLLPSWIPPLEALIPAERLAAQGLRWVGRLNGNELLATLGIDQHIDDAFGLVLCIVLHNDGLAFRQGRTSHRPEPGDWFIFDDRRNHGVKEARGNASFVALTLPLVPA